MSKDKTETEIGIIGAIILLIISIPLSLWGAFVLSTIWGWFLVPLGVPAIGIFHAWGIAIVWSHLNSRPTSEDENTLERAFTLIVFSILHPLIVLGFGAIAHGLM